MTRPKVLVNHPPVRSVVLAVLFCSNEADWGPTGAGCWPLHLRIRASLIASEPLALRSRCAPVQTLPDWKTLRLAICSTALSTRTNSLHRGIIRIMKFFFMIVISVFGFSIACSAYKSAGSPSPSSSSPSPAQNTGQLIATSTQEKTPCTLSSAGAPDISGLRLGMTPDEVLGVFPGSKTDPDIQNYLSRPPSQFGVSELVIKPAKFGSKDKFAGINQVTFVLLDGRVSTFTISYNGPEYSHVDKFVAKFLEGRNLPALDQWEPYVGMDTQMKSLKCADFEITVFAGGEGGKLNYVAMKDLVADKKLKDRRAKARANAVATPTPTK